MSFAKALLNSQNDFAVSATAALTLGVSHHGYVTVGEVFVANTLMAAGKVLPHNNLICLSLPVALSCLQCCQVNRGCVPSMCSFSVGIAKAKASFQEPTTTQARSAGFWESGAPVLLAGQVPDGEQSRPGFYSLPLFSHHS